MSGLTNQNADDEVVTVTLTLDNDEVVECAILTIYEVNDREYIALLPLDEDGENDSGDVYLYRYEETDGEPALDNIDDDDEYEKSNSSIKREGLLLFPFFSFT